VRAPLFTGGEGREKKWKGKWNNQEKVPDPRGGKQHGRWWLGHSPAGERSTFTDVIVQGGGKKKEGNKWKRKGSY